MKNLVNYLNDYFDDNIDETLSKGKFKNIDLSIERQHKSNKKTLIDEEIENHGKIKYNKKTKYKNSKY